MKIIEIIFSFAFLALFSCMFFAVGESPNLKGVLLAFIILFSIMLYKDMK